jgi:hypothetical protein
MFFCFLTITGLTVAVSNPIVPAVQTTQQIVKAASNAKDSRMKALASANTAMAASNAYDTVTAGQSKTIDAKEAARPPIR